MVVTSRSVELEVYLLRMKYLVQELFSQFCPTDITCVTKKGIIMLVETLQQLQFQKYQRSNPYQLQDSQYIEAFQTMLTNTAPNESAKWKYHEVKMKGLIDSTDDFNNASCQKSNQFKFWYVFLNDVASVLIDLNQSHRERNLDMHLCAVRPSIPLFFFFNCINNKRWVSLYYCMALKSRFPGL